MEEEDFSALPLEEKLLHKVNDSFGEYLLINLYLVMES